MATKFYSVSNSTNSHLAEGIGLHDIDSPKELFRTLNILEPLENGNWVISIVDYKGDVLEENVDWGNIPVTLTLQEIIWF